MLQTLLVLLGSLLLLTVGSEALVRGASAIARRFGVSSFFIGLTIVGFGTSTPELFTSIVAAGQDRDDIAVGNVVGSNIFNIAAILGLTALIAPIPLRLRVVRREVFVVIAASLVPFLAIPFGGVITRPAGILLVLLLTAYVVRGYFAGRREASAEAAAAEAAIEGGMKSAAIARGLGGVLPIVLIVAGLAALVFGADLLVESASTIARSLGVSDLAIGLTVVAAGTSAPELFTSMMAAFRKEPDIAIGNVLGSNIFNILGVLGSAAAVAPQHVHSQVVWLDGPVMLLASIALIPIMTSAARISRGEGLILFAGYVAYVVVLFTVAPQWFGGG